jgi:hypothetical protein
LAKILNLSLEIGAEVLDSFQALFGVEDCFQRIRQMVRRLDRRGGVLIRHICEHLQDQLRAVQSAPEVVVFAELRLEEGCEMMDRKALQLGRRRLALLR